MSPWKLMIVGVRGLVLSGASLLAENVALRHQLGVLTRLPKRPKLRNCDRTLWIVLSLLFADWKSWLVIVEAGHRDPVAPRRLPALLALEVAADEAG